MSRNGNKIRSFPTSLDERHVINLWTHVKNGLESILNNDLDGINLMELYGSAYTMVLHKFGERLYIGVRDVLTQHLVNQVRKTLLNSLDNIVVTLRQAWDDYSARIAEVKPILAYMERVYVEQNNVDTVSVMSAKLFLEHVVRYDTIGSHLTKTLLEVVCNEAKDREVIDWSVLRKSCQMLMDLGNDSRHVYEDLFERPLIERLKSDKNWSQESYSSFVCDVEKRIFDNDFDQNH